MYFNKSVFSVAVHVAIWQLAVWGRMCGSEGMTHVVQGGGQGVLCEVQCRSKSVMLGTM